MPVETFSYLDSLVATNPVTSEGIVNGDDHIRGIKSTLLASFPGVNAALTADTGASFQVTAPDGSSTEPSYSFEEEPTLGLYRSGAETIKVAGGNLAAGAVGEIKQFLVEPAGLGKAATGTGHDYLELDGSTWPNSAFPRLATHLGQGGSSFTLPDAYTTGRFLRSRTATVDEGTAQANQNAAHTHLVSGNTGSESVGHTHNVTGTTGLENQSLSHTHTTTIPAGTSNQTDAGIGVAIPSTLSTTTGASGALNHTHSFSVNSGTESAIHTHPVSITSASSGGTEARPEALSVIICIKT